MYVLYSNSNFLAFSSENSKTLSTDLQNVPNCYTDKVSTDLPHSTCYQQMRFKMAVKNQNSWIPLLKSLFGSTVSSCLIQTSLEGVWTQQFQGLASVPISRATDGKNDMYWGTNNRSVYINHSVRPSHSCFGKKRNIKAALTCRWKKDQTTAVLRTPRNANREKCNVRLIASLLGYEENVKCGLSRTVE